MIDAKIITLEPSIGGPLQKMYNERRNRAIKFVEGFKDSNYNLSIWDTTVNNLQSHIVIWNEPGDLLVFEDDCVFDAGVFARLVPAIDEFKTRGKEDEVLYLQRTAPHKVGCDRTFSTLSNTTTKLLIESNHPEFSGTAAYYITEAAKKHIMSNIRHDYATDKFFFELHRGGKLRYIIPRDLNNMFKLDGQLMWHPNWNR